MKKLALFIAIMFALAACGNKNPNISEKSNKSIVADKYEAESVANQSADINIQPRVDMVKIPPPIVKPDAEAQAVVEKKIIKEGSINFETGNVIATRKNILSALTKAGGYVSEDNESINSEENRKEYTLHIRIPAQNFDGFLSSVAETATRIESKNISIRDVTTEYIDTKTRLDNKKALEKRYLELLAKASKMSDVLDIENKLTEIRSDIEAVQGQLNYLNKQVTYSSLSITFYTKQAGQMVTGNGFGYKFKQALTNGVDFLQNLFFGIISVWPLWVILICFYLLIRRWVRRKRSRKE